MAIESRSGRMRMSLLAAVSLSLFIALFARLWFLQVLNETEFVARAADNTTDVVIEQSPRGRILDIKGRVLVDNRPSILLTIDREQVEILSEEDRDDLFLRLARELSSTGDLTKVSDIETAYASTRYGPFAEVPVVRDITEQMQVYFAERSRDFPGVNTTVVTVREYPYGNLAAHILGYVGPLNEAELEAVEGADKTYLPNDEIGKSGVELFYEDALRGIPGSRVVQVDRFNNIVSEVQEVAPRAGSDVMLTIDIEIQALAEEQLRLGLEEARRQETEYLVDGIVVYTAPAGAIVLMDPATGAIRAMASYPTYDPELFVSGISDADFGELTSEDSFLPLLNRATQGEYAPGSTFKPFTTYAALDTGLIGSRGVLGVRSGYEDIGYFTIPNCDDASCRFTNAGEIALGLVDLPQALTYSSDAYFYYLANNFETLPGFDRNSIQIAAQAFGFGTATGVTLPAESSGRMPTAAARATAHLENPDAFPNGTWTSGDTIITSIGQGDVLATPLQIANAYSAIANGGTLHSPNLGAAILDPITGAPQLEFGPRVIRDIYFPQAFSAPIYEGLAGVTTAPIDAQFRSGTAYTAFLDFPHNNWPVSGKTGTSEKKLPDRLVADYALFVGWGPANNPEYVAVVILEEAGFGGNYAAPVVRNIFEAIATNTVPEVLPLEETSARAAQAAADAAAGEGDGTDEANEAGTDAPEGSGG